MTGEDTGGAGTVLVAFVLGAITGAAVALLLAPTTGDEARRILSERARESRDKAAQAAKQGREFVTKQKETISAAIDRGREAYQQAREPKETPSS